MHQDIKADTKDPSLLQELHSPKLNSSPLQMDDDHMTHFAVTNTYIYIYKSPLLK